jgi:hypothetical protein
MKSDWGDFLWTLTTWTAIIVVIGQAISKIFN